MSKIAYLECPSGIAGDMCLGALIDIGVPWQYLIEHLANLGIQEEYHLEKDLVHRNSQLATKVKVNVKTNKDTHHSNARHLREIESIINSATLPSRVKNWSLDIFKKLAIAEGEVHGVSPEKVHFHEVGATDAIIDIVGTCIGLDWLGIDELYCSAMPTGSGTVKTEHGLLSVPVPAVLKLWESRGVPIYSNGIAKELVTPTGAAIATTLAKEFGTPPTMTIEKIGNGAGSYDLPIPNILRLWIGEKAINKIEFAQDTVSVLETHIDDLSPQAVAYTLERLLAVGALDVFTQSVGMKKSRSGILLTVICIPEKANICQEIIFTETTTLGIRHRTQQRSILDREINVVDTEYGKIRVKVASWGRGEEKRIINIQPEYEDCANLALENNIPLQTIQQKAIDVWNNYLFGVAK